MREFVSLRPEALPMGFDAEIHGEEPIVDVEESEARIVVRYTFPGFYVSEDSRQVEGEEMAFTQIDIAATGFLAESGKPLLPSFGRYVQIPFNCDYTVSVDKGEAVTFDDVLLAPAQELLTDSPDQDIPFEYDRELYAADVLYPEQIVRVSGPHVIDDYNALLLHVVPMQYNPAKKELLGYSDITITIDLTPRDEVEAAEEHPPVGPELDREAFGNLFLNPRRGVGGRLEIGGVGMAQADRFPRGPEFLIIYHETFKGAAEALAKWKKMRGLRTETVSIDSIGNSVNQIKAYIRGRRAGWSRLRYVLLLGDVDMIASYDTSTEPWGPTPWPHFYGMNITDYYYSTPKDPTAKDDYIMPWLSIGRIPVRTAAEGMQVVRKIIAYERHPPRDPDYYQRMTFAAYFQDTGGGSPIPDGKANRAYMKTMEKIRQQMLAYGFDVERVYVSETNDVQFYKDGTPVPPDVQAAVVDSATATARLVDATTKGQLAVGHRDHGTEDGWHEPPFGKTHLGSVTGKMPSLFFSVNCLTGKFDMAAPTESFAEEILSMSGAAPSLVAATRVSHTWLNDDLMKGLFDAMWGGVLSTFPGATASYPVRHSRLGDILNYAKAYLPVALSGSAEYIKDHFEIYHIVGDPTLEVWRDKPRMATIDAWVDGQYLHIKLYRVIKDNVITVWYDGNQLRRFEPSSSYMKIALPWHVVQKDLAVCFWAPGYRFRLIRPRRVLREDCIAFDYQQAEVKKIDGRWKIVVGNMWLLDFEHSESEARQALRILQHYRMNRQCFVGRPDPSMEYYLVDGAAPAGSMAGEDCIGFDPGKIEVKKVDGSWKIVEDSHWILDFGSNEYEARTAFQIIQKYGFSYICFVGRPNASMTYFRRA
jgi:hypothetical protein